MKLTVTSGELSISTDLTNVESVIKTCIDAGNSDIHITAIIPPPDSKFKIGDRVIDLAWDYEGLAIGASFETVFTVVDIRAQHRINSGIYKYELSYVDFYGVERKWYGDDDTLELVK